MTHLFLPDFAKPLFARLKAKPATDQRPEMAEWFEVNLSAEPNAIVLAGSGGDDILTGNAEDNVFFGGGGADRLVGGAGWDQANYGHAPTGVTVNLAWPQDNTGEAAGDTYVSIEDVSGSAFDDRLVGDGLLNHIHGAAGRDIISGLGGDDRIWGQAGDDIVLGGRGHDLLFGRQDNDVINAGPGDDLLQGGIGRDRLVGAQGNDTLEGGEGWDVSFGGQGADVFIFNHGDGWYDRIADFESGVDQISLQGGVTSYAFDLGRDADGTAGVVLHVFDKDGPTGSILLEGLSLADITAADVALL